VDGEGVLPAGFADEPMVVDAGHAVNMAKNRQGRNPTPQARFLVDAK
jgi:hypothetical protein